MLAELEPRREGPGPSTRPGTSWTFGHVQNAVPGAPTARICEVDRTGNVLFEVGIGPGPDPVWKVFRALRVEASLRPDGADGGAEWVAFACVATNRELEEVISARQSGVTHVGELPKAGCWTSRSTSGGARSEGRPEPRRHAPRRGSGPLVLRRLRNDSRSDLRLRGVAW